MFERIYRFIAQFLPFTLEFQAKEIKTKLEH